MNEIEFIRAQVETESQHLEAVNSSCVTAIDAAVRARSDEKAAIEQFCETCADYVAHGMARWNARNRVHCELLKTRLAQGDHEGQELLQSLERTLSDSHASLARLDAALGERRQGRISGLELAAQCREPLVHLKDVLGAARGRMERLLESHYGVEEWRRASLIDADSILEERTRYARVLARRPPGIDLTMPRR